METCCTNSWKSPCKLKNSAFSLVELLVVVAVIGIVAMIALPSISNISAAAKESAINAQERNLNGIYLSVKAASTNMPTEKNTILAYLATNSKANFVPPDSMQGPDGTLTLAYNAAADLFSYALPDAPPVPNQPVFAFNLPTGGITSDETTGYGLNGVSYPEAWFRNNPVTQAGGEDYYSAQNGGYQFEAFRINVGSDGVSGSLTTQSGQTYNLASNQFIQTPTNQIHWAVQPGGGIKVSSIVAIAQ